MSIKRDWVQNQKHNSLSTPFTKGYLGLFAKIRGLELVSDAHLQYIYLQIFP